MITMNRMEWRGLDSIDVSNNHVIVSTFIACGENLHPYTQEEILRRIE
jgi:hypothetical protein